MWTLLKNAADWATYQTDTARRLSLGGENIAWGSGPQSYPALVCTLLPPRPAGTDAKLYSAYVYLADAEELFKAAGRKIADPDAPVPPNQKQFNRWVAAQQMTVAYFLVETGICKKEQYEEKLLEMIVKVDEYHSDKREELKKHLTSYETTVLDTLEPPG